jgi:DNA-binding Xre family transcriptional regulator
VEKSFQTKDLFAVLKKSLKSKRISYKKLSENLTFSEGTLKNIFHSHNCSIDRIVEICNVIDISFTDLVQMASREKESEFSLSWEQEEAFALSPYLYYFFRAHFFEKLDLNALKSKYKLSDASITRYFMELEKIGLLDLHPNNKVKYHISGRQHWIEGGPWMQAFLGRYSKRLTEIVLDGSRGKDAYSSMMGFFRLSPATYEKFKAEVSHLEKKYKEIAYLNYMVEEDTDAVPVSWIFNIVPFDVYELDTEIPNI